MHSAARSTPRPGPRAERAAIGLVRLCTLLLLVWLASVAPQAARAETAELATFELVRNEDGLHLDYGVNFDLPRGAEEALNKAVPLYFVAEAEVFRSRWYWRDKRVAQAVRVWRIVFQPLTFTYRVTFAGISQSYPSRAEAFAAIRRGVSWKIAEAAQLEEGGRHYVEFNFRLDTSLLPRPMQIGIGNQPDWSLAVERMQRVD
jgi:hypothetical protein